MPSGVGDAVQPGGPRRARGGRWGRCRGWPKEREPQHVSHAPYPMDCRRTVQARQPLKKNGGCWSGTTNFPPTLFITPPARHRHRGSLVEVAERSAHTSKADIQRMPRTTRQATAAGLAALVAPVADGSEADGRLALKRAAATAPATEEHRRFRQALQNVADEWLCPISHDLPLDPVMAADSHFYERSSIQEWFRHNEDVVRSPVTNKPMGRALKSLPQVRSTIQSLMDSGAITGQIAASWHKLLDLERRMEMIRQLAKAGDLATIFVHSATRI